MQLFVRCGVSSGTVVVDCLASDTVADVTQKLLYKCSLSGNAYSLRLLHGGRTLDGATALCDVPNLQPGSTLQLAGRLRGGGGDGGSTGAESRSCYLEMYMGKKQEKVNPAEELLAKWTRCHLSGEKLAAPCVVDEIGFVYNKEAVVHALIHKTMPSSSAYITSLKHVTNLKLEPNSSQGVHKAASQSTFQPSNEADFCCPVTGQPFNGRFKFVVFKPTGHAVSEKAIKEVPSVVTELFGRKWEEEDLLVINPTGDLLETMVDKVLARMAHDREKKKSKKSKGDVDDTEAAASKKRQNGNGASDLAKKAKLLEKAPAGATSSVYASLFTSGGGQIEKETFCCRALSARGMKF